ncbi:MAG: S8 family serine peptidase [Acetobacteraceae bacterium]|nr:S8 family serine peptidase [Acetobacteraceae bacterium]
MTGLSSGSSSPSRCVAARLRVVAWALVLVTVLVPIPTSPPGASAEAAAPPTSAFPLPPDLEGREAAADVAPLLARGIVRGFPDGRFGPDLAVTRAQITQMLVLALGAGDDAAAWGRGPSPFPDLGPGHWCRGFAGAARELGLVQGYPDKSFRPDRPVVRAEAAVMLARALEAGLPRAGPPASAAGAGIGLPFPDAASIPSWSLGAVSTVLQRGLWPAPRGEAFGSGLPVTRAEAAGMVRRLMEARALLWDLAGGVAGVSGGQLELDTLGGLVTLPVAGGAWVARNRAPARLTDLTPLDQAAVVVGRAGAVCVEAFLDAELVELAGVEPDQGRLWLKAPGEEPRGAAPQALARHLGPACRVYRGGRPSSLAELVPGDRLFLVYDHWTGAVRLADAVRADFSGRVQAAPAPSGPLTLALEGGGLRSFLPAPGAVIFVDGRPADWEGLRAGDRVAALTLEGGRVVYLEAVRPAPAAAGRLAGRAPGRSGAAVAGPARGLWSEDEPGLPLEVNRSAMGDPSFQKLVGATGRGTLIAVVDTGVDAGTPELTLTCEGRPKLVDWVDFTTEGQVDTGLEARLEGGRLRTPLGSVTARSLRSKGGLVHWGVLRESQLAAGGRLDQDLDRNGSSQDSFLVVVADPEAPAVYDTVYVDSDRDLSLDDESPLGPFRSTGAVGWFGQPPDGGMEAAGPGCSFVVAEVEADGGRVKLGFDGNGHGTHVAGVAAGWGAGEGSVAGVASGAQIMALKALDSSGRGNWEDIARALRYAAQNGADVIALSVSGTGEGGWGWEREERLIRELGSTYGTLVVLAAGNNGPGLGSASVPHEPGWSLSVGAYLTPEMWEYAYGYSVPRSELWCFSAVGPGAGGRTVPDLVAPGVAVSCVPPWASPGGYELFEGTSVAVPHVAGAACLLLEAGRRSGLEVDGRLLARALRQGARPLDGYLAVEQGWGAVHLGGAWKALREAAGTDSSSGLSWTVQWPEAAAGAEGAAPRGAGGGPWDEGREGLYARASLPGQARVTLRPEQSVELEIVPDPALPWLEPDRAGVWVWPGGTREFDLHLSAPFSPGLQGGWLGLRPRDGQGKGGAWRSEARFPVVLAVPEPRPEDPLAPVVVRGRLGPAQYRRIYLRVEEGTSVLRLRLSAEPASPRPGEPRRSAPWGRVRLHAFDPQGREAMLTPFVGLPLADGSQSAEYALVRPQVGTWELVVYSSAALSEYGLDHSEFCLEARAERLAWSQSVHAEVSAGQDGWAARAAVRNLGGPAVLEALFTPPAPHPLTWAGRRLALEGDGTATVSLDDVPPGCRLLEVGVSNPSDGETDLDLYLYRLDPATGGWTEVGSSEREGVAAETVEVLNPAPGSYAACVSAPLGAPDGLTLQLDWLAVPQAGGAAVSQRRTQLLTGEEWALDLAAPVPPARGRYYASLVLRDVHRQEVLAVLPLPVDCDLPPLVVDVWPRVLGPGPTPVALQVRERAGGRAVEAELEVNGLRYRAEGGRALLLLPPASGPVDLAVTIADPRYRLVSASLRLQPPAPDGGFAGGSTGLPLWVDPGMPLSLLVQKVLAQR